MALTRKFLAALGIEQDKVDEIIEAHSETVSALKDEINKYKEDAEKLPGIQKELNDLKTANDGGNPFEQKYNDEHQAFEKYKNDVAAKESKAAKENAFRGLLKKAGISGDEKRIDKIMRVSDIQDIEIGEDGVIKDEEKIVNGIKEDWAEFIDTTHVQGAEKKDPPAGSGSGTVTKESIMSIKDDEERQKQMLEHKDLFGL